MCILSEIILFKVIHKCVKLDMLISPTKNIVKVKYVGTT